ncbi:MAG: zf-TFIIB domain-containing protein [Acidobacteria bacterium]|nr:zf-TFIIB domain-containing protein [Acidobacteriota bacterium]
MDRIGVGDTRLEGCGRCDGLWLDVDTFETVCADRERQSAVLSFLDKRIIREDHETKVSYVPCPECGQLMNRNNFARSSGVIVDICKKHGVWCDADELPKIVEFIQHGGMERAREKERLSLEAERRRLEDERASLARMEGSAAFGGASLIDERASIGAFARSLFE